jgi:hypothetical protein
MTASAQPRQIDFYGHHEDYYQFTASGFPAFVSAPSGTTAGTIVNPGTADPTGTQSAFLGTDMFGQFTIVTAGTQTTGALRTLFFTNPIPGLRPVLFEVFTAAGVQAGGAKTYTLTTASVAFSIGTALTTATTYTVAYHIL